MRQSTVKLLLVTFLFMVFLGGCGSETPVPNDNRELVVGSILSLTGGAASYGSDAEKGVQLALDEIRSQGDSLRVQLISMDDKSDKTEAAKVARQLIDINNVDVILGPAISPSALSVGKLAEERSVPMVATSATQDEITVSPEYNRQFVSRVCFNDALQGKALARFAVNALSKMKAAIIYDKTLSYSIGLAETFMEEYEALGGSVLYRENYSVNETDFSALIDKVAQFEDVELLFIPGWDENVGPMLRQTGDKWDRFTLLGGDGWPSNRLLELAGGNIKEAYALSHFQPDDPDSLVAKFVTAYNAKHGETPTAFAALGYDAMMLIYKAAQNTPSLDRVSLNESITGMRDLKLVTGTITFDEYRNPQKDVLIVKIHPDEITFFQRLHI